MITNFPCIFFLIYHEVLLLSTGTRLHSLLWCQHQLPSHETRLREAKNDREEMAAGLVPLGTQQAATNAGGSGDSLALFICICAYLFEARSSLGADFDAENDCLS
jgi:hypothetical protein